MRLNRCILWTTLHLCAAACCAAQVTIHVDGACGDDAWSGMTRDCEAPDGPKRTISAAANAAERGDTVLVAPGIYPMMTQDFSIHEPFTVRSSDGPFVTILDGEYIEDEITVNFIDETPAVIEGFTITRLDGYPAAIGLYYAHLDLINCRFIDNQGFFAGVVWMDSGSSSTVTATNCVFRNNSGMGIGGVFAEKVIATGCTFLDNVGWCIAAVDVSVSNTIIRGNPPHVDPDGDAIISYCNIQGGYPGGGNIDADPLFVDEAAGDLRLLPGSPCIDAGSNPAVPDWLTTDIAGRPRFVDDPATPDTGLGTAPVVDIGAHEFQAPCYPDFNGDGILDFFDFLIFINSFDAGGPSADCTGDGGLDFFDFLCFVNAFDKGC